MTSDAFDLDSIREYNSVFVLFDTGFKNNCSNPEEYITKLINILKEKKGDDVLIYTPEAKYGPVIRGELFSKISLNDKNKTNFVQDLENLTNTFEECFIISIKENDIYINGVKEMLTLKGMPITTFRYSLKESLVG